MQTLYQNAASLAYYGDFSLDNAGRIGNTASGNTAGLLQPGQSLKKDGMAQGSITNVSAARGSFGAISADSLSFHVYVSVLVSSAIRHWLGKPNQAYRKHDSTAMLGNTHGTKKQAVTCHSRHKGPSLSP